MQFSQNIFETTTFDEKLVIKAKLNYESISFFFHFSTNNRNEVMADLALSVRKRESKMVSNMSLGVQKFVIMAIILNFNVFFLQNINFLAM